MTVPLMVLALGSIVVGWLSVPKLFGPLGFHTFEDWLSHGLRRESTAARNPRLV